MDSVMLEGASRGASEKPKNVRAHGKIPAVYYGKGQKNMPLTVDHGIFSKLFATAGENTIIELSLDGKKYPVLVHEIQFDPLSDRISHIDFIHVDMNKEVTTSVKVKIVGTAPAVKNLAGILDVQKHELKIKCLPKDLIHSIEVDVSPIIDFTTTIHVKDVQVPSTIKLLDNPEDAVATVVPPRAEEEKQATPEAAPAEGAAATTAGTPAAPGAAPAAN